MAKTQQILSICKGESVTLTPAVASEIIEWRDNTGAGSIITSTDINGVIINNTSSTINVSPIVTTTYTVKKIGIVNLIPNGNFDIVQTSGISSYIYDAPVCTGSKGHYTITTNPLLFFDSDKANAGITGYDENWFRDIQDHTTSTGNMFVANGSTSTTAIVYKTTANVVAGQEYYVGAWFANIHKQLLNPYEMSMYVNGGIIGSIEGATNDDWYRKGAFWTATTTGLVSIELRNSNTIDTGNDFAIDDIVFSPVVEETFKVEVENCIEIPNTFTPNDDGINDTFLTGFKVQIYNRNGVLLFEGLDGWDGKYKSEYVSKGTYFYTLYYNNNSSQKTKNGYITVIR